MRRTRRGRFTSRRRAGRYRTRLVGRITGERRRRRGRGRRRGALENPVSGMEIVVGLITGAIGYTASDVLDRFLVSRARTDANGKPLGARWNTAPLMDDLLVRGGAGVAIAAVPLIAAHYVSSPMGRAALQFFGFGAAFRFIGKAVDDLATYLLMNGTAAADGTPALGRRLFGTELNSRKDVGLPAGTAGLGAPPCAQCGLGSCGCRSMLPGGPATGPAVIPPSFYPSPQIPPGGGQPPVVSNVPTVPPGYVPPGYVPPGARIPGSNLPGTPGTAPQSPIPAPRLPAAAVGTNGLGSVEHAQDVLRTHGPAYVALRRNRAALAAANNGTATREQRATADRVIAQHRGSFETLRQFHPNTLDTAARGLGFVVDDAPVKFPGVGRHRERDDAAE